MKRILSYLFAVILTVVSCIPVYAVETDFAAEDVVTEAALQTDNMTLETTEAENEVLQEELPDVNNNSGQVDVSIVSALLMQKNVEFDVSLTGQETKTVTLAGNTQEVERQGVTFGNLAAGTYTLTVSTPGFADFSQEIQVEGQARFVNLMTGFVSGYDYENAPHPGVLLIGDVNGDNKIDNQDKEQLIKAVDAGSGESVMDLNGDGEINLVDLEFLSKGFGKSETAAVLSDGVPAEAVDVKGGEDTAITGDLSALLTNEKGSVILKPAAGGDISSTNPVTLDFNLAEDSSYLVDGIVIDAKTDNPIKDMVAEVVYEEDGQLQTVSVPVSEGIDYLLENESVTTSRDASGTISIDFGSQIAVKKVTFKITGMTKDSTLAEISKVEFLNGMENRIPEPSLDIPQNVKSDAGNKKFTLTWDKCVNVTGYEVLIQYGEEEEVVYVKGNMMSFTSFKGDKLVNNEAYTVRVRAVNGTWRSGYSEPGEVVMKADKKPDPPDNLKVTGNYMSLDVSWKKMEDTDSYNIYYREADTGDYQKIEGIETNSYRITDLKDKVRYQVYVTGVNELGEGGASLVGIAETTDLTTAQMPKYKLINYAEDGMVSEHIINAFYTNGSMVDSPKDTEGKTAWGTVDNDQYSHFLLNSWDSGGFNNLGVNGVTYEFDKAYKMQNIAFKEVMVEEPAYSYVRVRYWDENDNQVELPRMGLQAKTDSEGRKYYLIRLPQAVNVKKIQIGLARYVASGRITMSEVYFYHYDSIEDDIMALYEDDLHTVLRSDVTQANIDELRTRINTPDEVSGEYHPEQEKLERELKTAEDILNSVLSKSVEIHNGITTSEVNRGFGGLNAWQPLGITAAADEEITVYVGHNSKKTGENTNLQLVATQYHAESSPMFKVVATLKIGRNDIKIPKLSTLDVEAGGALYVQYTGTNANDRYAVRVSGGNSVPILDLYKVTDRTERIARAEAYLEQLQNYVNQIETEHNEKHKASKLASVNRYDYQAQNCILGASDIMADTMMLSLPAQQILSGSKGSAETLVDSIDAMENMMYLFYQHKGLNNSAPEAKDRFPSGHQNIRYQRMFAGAFMYASGNHIGIEWGSTPGMAGGKSVQADEDGKYISGNYFGWGIAHEIGHCINQGSYAVAEITNNYFAVLAQAKDRNDSVRFKYRNVYDKVTSGTKGNASNVFTQLGMYWQLHLAYDNGYNYKTYSDYEEQLNNLFFARVDTYARTPSKAPKPGGVELSLSGDKDQILMRLSCGAAEKNLLEFFERWGKTPDETTISYAEQFEKETRAIYYANDDSRVYRLENAAKGSSLGTEGTVEAVGSGTKAEINANSANQVDFTLASDNKDVLGYEIVRCTISGGQIEKEVVGFTTENTFSDYVTTMNNRVVIYEVTVIDHFLNRSAAKTLTPLKIEHKGNIDKKNWSISTSGLTATSKIETDTEDKEDTCGASEEAPITSAIDNDVNTVYTGVVGNSPQVIIEFNQYQTITGFEYKAGNSNPIEGYNMYIQDEDGSWKSVSEGTLNKSKTVYFGKGQNVAAYSTMAVKLEIKNASGKEISIAELDMLGITGDNVDLAQTLDNSPAIGVLKSDFTYDSQGNKIPAGSIIFTGNYKGNPAYNVVVLYDQDGNIVTSNDEAEHIILADVPNTGNIQDVNAGSWIYWIAPDDKVLAGLKKVRAELYRVDNALTNEGQRLVSDSLFVDMPENLPEIVLSQSGNK